MNTVELANQELAALRDLRNAGQLAAEKYGKMVVELAAHLTSGGFHERAVEMLRSLPAEYYAEHQPKQMESDETFCTLSFQLARALIGHGYPVEEDDVQFTMGHGDA